MKPICVVSVTGNSCTSSIVLRILFAGAFIFSCSLVLVNWDGSAPDMDKKFCLIINDISTERF